MKFEDFFVEIFAPSPHHTPYFYFIFVVIVVVVVVIIVVVVVIIIIWPVPILAKFCKYYILPIFVDFDAREKRKNVPTLKIKIGREGNYFFSIFFAVV